MMRKVMDLDSETTLSDFFEIAEMLNSSAVIKDRGGMLTLYVEEAES